MSLQDWLRNVRESFRGPDTNKPWVEIGYEKWGSVHEFVDFVDNFANIPRLSPENAGFLFRGQADSSWSLKPSLWRQLEAIEPRIIVKDALRIEFDSIRHFKARAHLCLASQFIPHENDIGGWLTLMQHYRAPTRMLDWTTSLNVALYFAVADCCVEIHEMKPDGEWSRRRENQPGAVWCFATHALLSSMVKMGYAPHSKERYAQICQDQESFVAFGLNDVRPNIWAYYPDVPTDRMLVQKGIHTFSEKPLCDHAELIGRALLNHPKDDRNGSLLIKLIIPPHAKAALREHLIKTDVHASTLFPGLDGIGSAVSEMIELEIKASLPGAMSTLA